jgi:MOSC domain-containing protein
MSNAPLGGDSAIESGPIHVVSLHRYPVKTMAGEPVTRLEIDERGCVGDRLWSVRTSQGKIASGKSTQRFEALPSVLELRARARDGVVVVTFPDGSTCITEDASAAERLSHYVGRPATFAKETSVSHFDDGPVSLIGSASVTAVAHERGEPVDPARFRPNIVLDTSQPFSEDGWVGRELAVGSAVLSVTMTSPRCAMVDMKTAELPAQHGNLLAVGRANRANLGVIASVQVPGAIHVGDMVEIR